MPRRALSVALLAWLSACADRGELHVQTSEPKDTSAPTALDTDGVDGARDTDLPAALADTDDTDTPVDTDTTLVPVDTDTSLVPVDTDTSLIPVDTDTPLDTSDTDHTGGTSGPPADLDGDGWTSDVDCDDASVWIHPVAPELCDGLKNDCSTPWTPQSEDGFVSFEDVNGAWSDVTAAFTAGASGVPYLVQGSGTLWVCPGTWHRSVELASGRVAVRGRAGPSVTTLDADGLGSVVTVDASVSATIEGLHLTHGHAAGEGGGVAASGARTLVLQDVLIDENTAEGQGGGVYTYGLASLTWTDVELSRNVANGGTGGGAAILSGFSATAVSMTRVTFDDDGVYADQARTHLAEGGGLYLRTDTFLLDGVTFSGCWADGGATGNGNGGGAKIYPAAFGAGDPMVLRGVRATGNSATGGGTGTANLGGGIDMLYNGRRVTLIEDSEFADNRAGASTTQRGNGGGLSFSGLGGLELNRTVFERNFAGSGFGGGVSASSGSHYSVAPGNFLHLSDVTFIQNEADSVGGADLEAGEIRVVGVEAAGNIARGFDGGAMYVNTAVGWIGDSSFHDGVAGRNGGGLEMFGTFTLDNVDIRDNSAVSGGGLYGGGYRGGETITLSGGTQLIGNRALYGGGAVVVDATLTCVGAPATPTGFRSNTAALDGGAVLVWAAAFTGSGCDLGEEATPDDNSDIAGADVAWRTALPGYPASYGDNATFVCDALGCR